MTKVNVSATVGECRAIVGRNVRDSGGNDHNSGEIEYALRNLRLAIVIHNFA